MAAVPRLILVLMFVPLLSCGHDSSSSEWDIEDSVPDDAAASETTVEDIQIVEGGRAVPHFDIWVSLAKPTACIRMGLGLGDQEFDVEMPENWTFLGASMARLSCRDAQFSQGEQTDPPYYPATSVSGRISDDEHGQHGFALDLVLNFAPDDTGLPDRVEVVSQENE